MTFDAATPSRTREDWLTEPRMLDRDPLSLDGVDELVVVAAHPDDETLGAGGLLAECARRGIRSTVVFVTDGAASGEPGIAQRRRHEAHGVTGLWGATPVFLDVPDGATRENRQRVRELLTPLIAGSSRRALIVCPWRGDGHRDHRVVGEVVAELVGGRRLLEFPIWMWHWASPDDVPWDALRVVSIDAVAKQRALDRYPSQTQGAAPVLRPDFLTNFAGAVEYFIESPRTLGAEFFDETYARREDPWGFESRWYEQRKRAVTLAALPDERYERAFEIGCSIGVLTESLAARASDLLAVDISQAAVDRAAARVPSARVERRDVSADFPAGEFDLVVLSEVGYYFDVAGLKVMLANIDAALGDTGVLVACHWLHPVADYPLDGETVHELIRARGIPSLVTHRETDFVLEVFSRDARSVAQRTGLA